jgi:hypothetical protein
VEDDDQGPFAKLFCPKDFEDNNQALTIEDYQLDDQ